MTQPQAEFLDLYRAGLKTSADLMKASLQNAERLQNQQLSAIRSALDQQSRAVNDLSQARSLDELLSPWRDKYPKVPVEALVTRDSPARVLVGVSRTARLVVVGSHGHGAVAGTLLGSVGSQLLHHADCPVLIART